MGHGLPQRVRRVAFGVLTASSLIFLSGCSGENSSQFKRLGMPVPATKQAPDMLHLWQWSWVAAIATGLVTLALILYAIIRFRRRSADEVPVQTRYNLPIEIFYTVAPLLMVIVLFFWTVKTQDAVLEDIKNPDATITVVGQQWSWTFNYNYDAGSKQSVGGQTVWETGTTADPPVLWLVKDHSVEVHLYSPDVIHSFWVPAFLFKMDVFPGRDNHFGFTPNRYGTFVGRCAELCGVYHSRMLFQVKVVDQAQYDAHLAQLAAEGNVGPNLGGAHVTLQPGLAQAEGN